MGEILTNSTFVTGINKIITKLGGTPSDISITPDQANDIVNNSVFASKMDEVIKRYSGTPTVITLSDDEANDMVNKEVFSNKIDKLSKVISRGGSGSDLPFVEVNITVNAVDGDITPMCGFDDDIAGDSNYTTGFFLDNDDGVRGPDNIFNGSVHIGNSASVTVYLVKNHSMYLIDGMYDVTNYVVTGNAEVKTIDIDGRTYYYVKITGDCTITV